MVRVGDREPGNGEVPVAGLDPRRAVRATPSHGVDRGLDYTVADPPELKPGGNHKVSEALKDRPMRFGEIMEATGSRDGREVIVELEMLRETGKLSRLDDGCYALAD